MQFKQYLLTESKQVFSNKIGNLLNGLQTLKDDIPHMGMTERSKYVKDLVNQIRRILKDRFDDTLLGEMKVLQKIGVSLMRGLEESNIDLKQILVASISEVEKLLDKLRKPINNVGNAIQELN